DPAVRTEGARTVDDAADAMCRHDRFGRDAAFQPLFERGLHVECIRTGPAATMRHPRRHEQPVKALHVSDDRGSILSSYPEKRQDALVVVDAVLRGDQLVAPAVI